MGPPVIGDSLISLSNYRCGPVLRHVGHGVQPLEMAAGTETVTEINPLDRVHRPAAG